MRVTRIREDGGGRVFELHPRLTVIVGLGPAAHDDVAEALVTAADGAARVVDADAVRAEPDPLVTARRLRLDAVEAATTSIVAAVERSIGLLDQELAEVAVQRTRLTEGIAEARRALDPLAPDAAAEAQELVDRLTEELGAIPGTGFVVPLAALAARVVHLEEELRSVRDVVTDPAEEAELVQALEEASSALTHAGQGEAPTAVALDDPRLAAALDALEVARDRWSRHEDALAVVTDLLRALDELEEDEELAALQREELVDLLAAARRSQELASAHTALDVAASASVVDADAVRSLTDRSAEELLDGRSGPTGLLVVAGALDGLSFSAVVDQLDRLAELGDRLQIVVLTDHPAAVPWAAAAGPDAVGLRRS